MGSGRDCSTWDADRRALRPECGKTCGCPRVDPTFAPVRRSAGLYPLWVDGHTSLDHITDAEWVALRAYLIVRHDKEQADRKRRKEADDAAAKIRGSR